MLVSCSGSTRSIYLSDPSAALTESQIVDGVLFNLSVNLLRSEVAEIVAQMFDAIEEKNFEQRPTTDRRPPLAVPNLGPRLVSSRS